MMRLSRLPQVSGDRLFLPDESGEQQTIVVIGSDAWYNWLMSEDTRSFTFKSHLGTFTARRERKRNGWYWYAYHKQQGKLHKAYLGKGEELSQERLLSVAEVLLNQDDGGSHSEQTTPQGSIDRARPLNQDDGGDRSEQLSTTSVEDEKFPLLSQTPVGPCLA